MMMESELAKVNSGMGVGTLGNYLIKSGEKLKVWGRPVLQEKAEERYSWEVGYVMAALLP